jgi:hypothetical protein
MGVRLLPQAALVVPVIMALAARPVLQAAALVGIIRSAAAVAAVFLQGQAVQAVILVAAAALVELQAALAALVCSNSLGLQF